MAKTQTREEWLAARREGIGGTDWADILAMPPYGCERRCWYDKTGVEADYPQEVSGAMKRGNKMETLVFDEFEDTQDRALWRPNPEGNAALQFEETWGLSKKVGRAVRPPWWIGTPDAVILQASGERKPGVFEAKTVGPWAFVKIAKEGIPERTVAQRQHYLGLSGWSYGVVGYLEPVDWKFIPCPYDRDAEILRMMLDVGDRFWRKNVIEGNAPTALDPTDSRCKDCQWFPTCQGDIIWSGSEEVQLSGDYTQNEDEELARAIRERIEIFNVKKDAEKMIDELNEAVRVTLDAGSKVITADGHKVALGTGFFTRQDSKAFKAKYPRLAKAISERFKVTKPGTVSVTVYPKKGE